MAKINSRKKLEKLLIDISIKIAREGKGCLLVIKEDGIEYKTLLEQDIKPFNVLENNRRLEVLASFDGAVIIDVNGKMIAYSAKIKSNRIFPGFGTRHTAAYSASLKGNTAILASEEDRKVRVFKQGKLIMQIDPFEKNIEYKTSEVVSLLESIGAGSIATIGTSLLVPSLGIALIPGIVVFGSAHYLMKILRNRQ